jgi:hypothetical protein
LQLYDAFGEEDPGYSGDIRVTNEWARILKISDWFAWIGFENMPDSYLNDA